MVVVDAVRTSVFGLHYPPSLASKQSKRCRMDGKNVSRVVDLETEGGPYLIFLSANLSSEEDEQYIQLLKEYLNLHGVRLRCLG
ncbi:hypothetical protein V6N12_062714 [Hibiscus sabdariffa]|uniref:Uncharacterized protein n=1 Tax=Hibiscus sabdariffa TaxID=183260 RepID=A0ABR2F9X8_9ROSI